MELAVSPAVARAVRAALLVAALACGRQAALPSAAVAPGAPGAAPAAGPPGLWLAVTRPALAAAIEPLAARRRAQGLEVRIETIGLDGDPARAIAASPRRPAYVLLVGDAPGPAEPREADWAVPTPRRPLYRWRAVQGETFAADALLGDLDGDLLPDVPVGRIPARSPEDVARVVARTVAHEERPAALADLRQIIWGGAPGMGELIDRATTALLLSALERTGPRWTDPWVVMGDPTHPLCGHPPDQPALFAGALAGGGALAVLMGHGSQDRFFGMQHGGDSIGFGVADVGAYLDAAPGGGATTGPPPTIVIDCLSGNFAWSAGASLAEALLLAAGGPPAVIGATTESHPLPNYFTGLALLEGLAGAPTGPGPARLGDLWLAAQRRALELRDPLVEWQLAEAEGKLDEEIDPGRLRRDQLLLYALLGDPALRLRTPLGGAEATVAREDGGGWSWRATKPAGAVRLHVGHRAFRPPVVTGPAGARADADTARRRFREFNEALAYRPIATLEADQAWEGTLAEEGELRLVVETEDGLRVTVVRLER